MPADSLVVFLEGVVAETPQGLTVIPGRARNGDERGWEELIALIYDELRRVASRLMRRARPVRTLAPTAVVHEARDRLAELDGRQAQVMTLRYFGGMTVAEVAGALGIPMMTVEQDWRLGAGLAHRPAPREGQMTTGALATGRRAVRGCGPDRPRRAGGLAARRLWRGR